MKFLLLAMILVSCNPNKENKEMYQLKKELGILKKQEQEDLKVGQYALNMMVQVSSAMKLSDAKKQTLARDIVRVTSDVFDTFDQKKAFIAVIAIESSFNRFAQSPTGPKGYTQVTKAAFKEAMRLCGITNADESDSFDQALNLYAGACYFRNLLNIYNNDIYKALVAYNQGPSSTSAKSYSKNGSLNELEPLKYIARYSFLKNNTPIEKAPNAPTMEAVDKKVSK